MGERGICLFFNLCFYCGGIVGGLRVMTEKEQEQEQLNELFTDQLKVIIDSLEEQVKINRMLIEKLNKLEKQRVLLC